MAKDYSIKIDTQKFNKDIQSYLKRFNKGPLKRGLKRVAFALLGEVIRRNPVDTGRSRAGWYTGAQKLGISVPRKETKEERQGESEGTYKEKLNGNNQYIEIGNSVKYTPYLEFGHSKQAPSGMVRISMQKISKEVKSKFGGHI